MNNPKVSVILTSYNKEAYIGKAIESVLGQSFNDFELIIADDGSSDNSLALINKYAEKDERIRVYYFEKNKGIPSAHNMAISMSNGKYIAMIDCDDFWEKNKLEKQVGFLEDNPEYGACFSWIKVVDEKENEVSSEECEYRDVMWNSENHTQGEWLRLFFTEGCKLGNPSMLVRSSVISEIGGYTYGLKQLQDYDLFIRILKKCNVYIINEKLVNYRWLLGAEKNTSYDNIENTNRTNVEYYLICKSFFDNMDMKVFKEGFSEYFIDKNSDNENDLICEQIFITRDRFLSKAAGKMAATENLFLLLNNKYLRSILEEKYNINSSVFSADLREPLLFEPKYYMPVDNASYVNELKQEIERTKQEWYKTVDYTKILEGKENEASEVIEKHKEYIAKLEEKEREAAALISELKTYITGLEAEEERKKTYITELEGRVKEGFSLYDKALKYIKELEDVIKQNNEQNIKQEASINTLTDENKRLSEQTEQLEKIRESYEEIINSRTWKLMTKLRKQVGEKNGE